MFAIGHFALGYFAGKGASKLLKVKLNLPLLLAVSVIPDVDLILQSLDQTLFMHRGPSHSIITFTVLMIPFFIIYKKQAVPYYAALLSHVLIGDIFTGGIELFWPLSQGWFSYLDIDMASLANVLTELILFITATSVMFKAKDLHKLLQPKNHNLVLLIAFGAVLGPMLEIGQGSDSSLPALLVIPCLFWLALFAYSIIADLRAKPEKPPLTKNPAEPAG